MRRVTVNCGGEHGLEKFKSNLEELRQAAGLPLDELADVNIPVRRSCHSGNLES